MDDNKGLHKTPGDCPKFCFKAMLLMVCRFMIHPGLSLMSQWCRIAISKARNYAIKQMDTGRIDTCIQPILQNPIRDDSYSQPSNYFACKDFRANSFGCLMEIGEPC